MPLYRPLKPPHQSLEVVASHCLTCHPLTITMSPLSRRRLRNAVVPRPPVNLHRALHLPPRVNLTVTGVASMVQDLLKPLARSVVDAHHLHLYGFHGHLELSIWHAKSSIARPLCLCHPFVGICLAKRETHGMITFRLDHIIHMNGEVCFLDLD